jgi:RNA polymerase sigma factor (sigma-70 family)
VQKRQKDDLLGRIRHVVSAMELCTEPDQELLRRFVGQHDEAAFAAIVRRHGPMVMRVAVRTLQNEHDAEDVFQATFLVLSQKSQSLRRQGSLGSWLYGIAYRIALKAKATAGGRRNREQRVTPTPVAGPLAQITVQEAQTILDEELHRLPEQLREPVVLCCLEGLARDEAAQRIGCSAGELKSRLERGRERLRLRLVARGLTLPCGMGAFLLLECVAQAAVPPALISSITKAAMTIAAGKAATTVVSAKVAALTEGVLRTMLLTKLKIAIVALVLGFMLTAATVFTYRATAAHGAPLIAEAQPALEQKQEPKQEKAAFTAWGNEINGLQAGVGFRPGEKRAYSHGETVNLVVRVRNVSDKEITLKYIPAYFFDRPPSVTDSEGKAAPQLRLPTDGHEAEYNPKELTLAPGKEIELGELKLELRPESESGNKRLKTLYGTGKFVVHYERVMYPSGRLMIEPILHRLPTGKLELDVKSEPPPADKKPKQKQKEKRLTAWGNEVGGLQAGVTLRPEKRIYRHGEVITLVVRIRNVGREAVKFEYVRQFLDEELPTVTNADGMTVKQHRLSMLGFHVPLEVTLEPGKEIELESRLPLRYELRPANDGDKPATKERSLFVGTGKVSIQYDQVLGSSSSGTIKLDPTLSKLATGKLELDINSDAPAAPETNGE